MGRNCDWDDDRIDPLKGRKEDAQFLRSNYRFMQIGSSFRTVKARFSPARIQKEAAKAGFKVQIDEEGPWLKVTAIKKIA